MENNEEIDNIIQKGKEGTLLNKDEIRKLMLHAISILKYIETITLENIRKLELSNNIK